MFRIKEKGKTAINHRQSATSVPIKINTNKSTARHIIVKVQNVKVSKEILPAKKATIRLTADTSSSNNTCLEDNGILCSKC